MSSKARRPPIHYFKWTLLSLMSGVLAGIAASVFLYFLDWATKTRESHLEIIWFLPLAGLFIGLAYHRYGNGVERGNNLILEEIQDPKRILPLRMAPFVLLGTVFTHLFGGSAGREGTAVQMGAALSDQLSKYFKIESDERKILLVAGAGAGFGAAIGTPWAGVLFGMEVINVGKLRLFAPFECLVASFTAYFTAVLVRAPHSVYPSILIPGFAWDTLGWVVLAGIVFGLTAKLFTTITHTIERFAARWISYPPLRPMIAGCLLCFLYWWEGSNQYAGLGISTIQKSLLEPSTFNVPALKLLFTALTIGAGFKGGEFIPLVFMGSTLGSALSHVLPVSFDLLAALGFAAVFAGGSNTPLACTVMAMEVFGPKIGLYALVACFGSYYFSGHHGIYKSQPVIRHKWRHKWSHLLTKIQGFFANP